MLPAAGSMAHPFWAIQSWRIDQTKFRQPACDAWRALMAADVSRQSADVQDTLWLRRLQPKLTNADDLWTSLFRSKSFQGDHEHRGELLCWLRPFKLNEILHLHFRNLANAKSNLHEARKAVAKCSEWCKPAKQSATHVDGTGFVCVGCHHQDVLVEAMIIWPK